MKKLFAVLLCALALPTLADPASAPATVTPPDEFVRVAATRMQDMIRENHAAYRADTPLFYRVVDETLVPLFDVPFISRSVLGRNYRTADATQRSRFQAAFKNMLIRSYANALLEYYDSVRAEWKPLHLSPGVDDVTVSSTLLRDGKPPVSIGFSTHLVDGSWKVYDISVEGISLVTNFRGQLNSEIKRAGLDEVIGRMESGDYSTRRPTSSTASATQGEAQATSTP